MKLHKNIRTWAWVTFFSQAAFTLPIWYLFGTQYLGFSSYKTFLVSVATYGLSAIFEIPTGSWADKFGRVKIFQIGTLLYLLSLLAFILSREFYIILAFQIVGALGIAMRSGTIQALVHDTLHSDNIAQNYSSIYGQNMGILYASRLVTTTIGAGLYGLNPLFPFIGMAVFIFLSLILSAYFSEVRLDTPSELSSAKHIRETFKRIIGHRFLIALFAVSLLYRFVAESLFTLYQPFFQKLGISTAAFGVLYALIAVCSGVGTLFSGKLMKRLRPTQIFSIFFIALLSSLILALYAKPWTIILVIIPSALIFGMPNILIDTLTQNSIRSRYQSTALSVTSMIETGLFFLAVNVTGLLVDILDIYTIYWILICISAVGLVITQVMRLKRYEADISQ